MRKKLDLHTGDSVIFELVDGNVVLRKLRPLDYEYHRALSHTLSEWNSKEDELLK